MAIYRLPVLDKNMQVVDLRTGRITPDFQRFWQNLTFTAVDGANQSTDVAALQSQVTTLNGQMSTVNATLPGKADLASPTFTGDPKAPTAAPSDNDTTIATTAFVTGAVSTLSGTVTTALATKAPLASPTFTGTPAAPTPPAGTNTTQLATTAFVRSEAVRRATFNTWVAATGTAERTTFATYDAPTISAAPTQAEVQAIADHVQVLSRRLKALIDDVKA